MQKNSGQTNEKAIKSKNFNEKRVYFAFPHLALAVIFVIVPLAILFAYAFIKDGSFSLSNFSNLARVEVWSKILDSFLMAFATTVICFLLCYPLALALNRIKSGKNAIFVMLFVLPMWINSLLRIFAIKVLFDEIFKLNPGFLLTLIGMVYDFLPFMLLPIYTIIANTDKSYIEASQDLGASPVTTLIKIRLPLSVPGIISGVVMVFMPSVSTFAISEILGGTFNMFGQYINAQFMMDYGAGSVYSIVLMLLIIGSVIIANRLSKGKASLTSGGTV